MGISNSSTATLLDSSPTSKQQHNHQHFFQYAYLNSASQWPRLPRTPRSGQCTKQQQHHRVLLRELVNHSVQQRPVILRDLFHRRVVVHHWCVVLLRGVIDLDLFRGFVVHDPFIIAVHLLRPILVGLGVLIVIILISVVILHRRQSDYLIDRKLNIFVRNANRFPICSILLDYPNRSLEETSTRLWLLFGCGLLVATDACTVTPPTAFTIDADRLRAGDSFATATAAEIAAPGYSAVEFSAVAAAGDVQTVFAVGAGLTWTNAAFLNGAAGFCLLNNVVQAAYTVPVASIADCVPITLTSSQDVCDTPVTTIIIVVNVINGATVTATSTETKTVTNPITGTSGPVVTSSVGNNGTVYYTTTVACAQCQCPGYVPGQLTVIATKSVCPVCVASTVTPVTATVIPCATCPALVPGTATQTAGGNPSTYTVLVPATGTAVAGTPGKTPVVVVTGTAAAGNPTSPVTYTGAASSISAKGAVFGIVVGLFLSLC